MIYHTASLIGLSENEGQWGYLEWFESERGGGGGLHQNFVCKNFLRSA